MSQNISVHSTDDSGTNIIPGIADGNDPVGNGSTYQIFRNAAPTGDSDRTYYAKDKDGNVETIAVGGGGLPYKIYVALLSQSGANNPPTAIVLQNTLGVTPTFTYDGQGAYQIVATGKFTSNKTWFMINQNAENQQIVITDNQDGNTAEIITVRMSDETTIDGILIITPVEIRVYP